MENNHREAIILAALLHDIGKFSQRAGVSLSDKIRARERFYCVPCGNYFSHRHTLYTHQFLIENLKKYERHIPIDTVTEWAAKHHQPEKHVPEQIIISEADKLSSGMDRKERDEEIELISHRFRQIRLRSIFSLLELDKKPEKYGFLKCIPSYPDRFEFPITTFQNQTPDNEGIDPGVADEFKTQWEHFENFFSGINFYNWQQFLLAIDNALLIYTSSIPSSVKEIPSVSLYDHSRTTAAIASALYEFHKTNNSLYPESIGNRKLKKFRFLGGDFSGIQRFIFDLDISNSKGVAKILRARSFIVSALTHMAILYLCYRADIPLQNLIMESAGRFALLLPNLTEKLEKIESAYADMQKWLLNEYLGKLSLNINFETEFSPEELQRKNFSELWGRFLSNMEKSKLGKLSKVLIKDGKWEEGAFLPMSDDEYRKYKDLADGISGDLPGDQEIKGDVKVNRRTKLEYELGGKLTEANKFLIFRFNAIPTSGGADFSAFTEPQVHLELTQKSVMESSAIIYTINPGSRDIVPHFKSFYLANHIPRIKTREELKWYSEIREMDELEEQQVDSIRTFQQIALQAIRPWKENDEQHYYGNPLIGVLKADVDNLGLIFRFGQPDFSISEMVTLSRELNFFFSAYLPYKLKESQKNIYTVFAGGDDLMFVGDWETILMWASELREMFRQYTCANPNFTISAAILFNKPGEPIRLAARKVDELLEQKSKATSPNSIQKDKISIDDDTVDWEKFEILKQQAKELNEFVAPEHQPQILSSGMLYKFLTLNRYYRRFILEGDIFSAIYRSLMRYFVGRNIGTTQELQNLISRESDVKKKETYEKKLYFLKWLEKYLSQVNSPYIGEKNGKVFNWLMLYFNIPLTYVLYHNRKFKPKGGKNDEFFT